MLIGEMSIQECRDMLSRQGFGRLACAHQNQPYITPIYFAYEPDHLYGFTTLGQKVEWMRSNPLVCVEVDDVLSHFRWSSVVVLGRYEELPDTPQYSGVRLQAQLRLEKRALWWQTAYAANQAPSKTTLRMPFSIAYTSKRSAVGGLLPIQWNRQWDSRARSVPRARNDPIGPFQIEIARGERNLSTVIGVTPRSYSPFKQAHLARAPSVNTIIAVRSAKSGSLGRDVIPLTACCDSYHSSAYQKRVNISLEL